MGPDRSGERTATRRPCPVARASRQRLRDGRPAARRRGGHRPVVRLLDGAHRQRPVRGRGDHGARGARATRHRPRGRDTGTRARPSTSATPDCETRPTRRRASRDDGSSIAGSPMSCGRPGGARRPGAPRPDRGPRARRRPRRGGGRGIPGAGARARTVYANREALDHLATALALGHPDVAAIETTIGELRTILGDYLGAITALESAAAVSAEEDLPAIELRLGRVHARRGDTATAASHLDGALDQMERLGPSADARLLGAIVVERSIVAVRSGDLPLADDSRTGPSRWALPTATDAQSGPRFAWSGWSRGRGATWTPRARP